MIRGRIIAGIIGTGIGLVTIGAILWHKHYKISELCCDCGPTGECEFCREGGYVKDNYKRKK